MQRAGEHEIKDCGVDFLPKAKAVTSLRSCHSHAPTTPVLVAVYPFSARISIHLPQAWVYCLSLGSGLSIRCPVMNRASVLPGMVLVFGVGIVRIFIHLVYALHLHSKQNPKEKRWRECSVRL